MSAFQAPSVGFYRDDEVQSDEATQMIDIYHRPNASSPYTLLYLERKETFVQLTSGERGAFIKIFQWMTTYWTTGREDGLHMGMMSISKYMRLRYMTRKLDCPSLTDYIAKEIAFLLKCGMTTEEMDGILEWTANGDEDWSLLVDYAATEVFKRRVHMDEYYNLFEEHEGFLFDVKQAVNVKRDERDQQLPPPDPSDDFHSQDWTYWGQAKAAQKKADKSFDASKTSVETALDGSEQKASDTGHGLLEEDSIMGDVEEAKERFDVD